MKARTILASVAILTLFSACAAQADAKPPQQRTEPLPLTAHVVASDALSGFETDDEPALLTVAEFAEQHEKDVAELEKDGMRAAATLELAPSGGAPGHAMSIAVQYRSTAGARKEAARLFASNSEAEEGLTVTQVDLPGIPGGRAAQLDGEMDGQSYRGIEIVFTDGKVMHELFAFTLASNISVPDVVAAATDLYERVQGHPVG